MYLGEVSLLLFFLSLFYFIWTGKSRRYEMKGAEHISGWYKFFYYGAIYPIIWLRKRFHLRLKGDRLDQMKKIYVGSGEEEIFYLHYGRTSCYLAVVLMIGLFCMAAGSLTTQKGNLLQEYFLKRDDLFGQEKTVTLTAAIDGDEKDVTVPVLQKQYTSKQLEKKQKEAKKFVNKKYLGENSSPDRITKPLNLVTDIAGNAIKISWKLDADGVVQANGDICNEELEEPYQTEIKAVFSYGDIEESITKSITILPKKKTEQELVWECWQGELVAEQEKSRTEDYLKLPEQAAGKKVSYMEKGVSVFRLIVGLLLFVIVMVILLQEERIRKEIRIRERELKVDYPEFVEHFVLLIGAGLNIKGAWERITMDYKKEGKEKHYVYEEMLVSMREMENGMGEARAYELFGKRTGHLQYMKFCTLIVQNLKKGSEDLLRLLDYEVADAFRERKENAKALGEEAGTKLLLPMVLMLAIVFALILYAAFNNM